MKTLINYLPFILLVFCLAGCVKNEEFVTSEVIVVETETNIEVQGRSVISGDALAYYCENEDATEVKETIIATNIEDYLKLSLDPTVESVYDLMKPGEFIFISLKFVFAIEFNYLIVMADIGNGPQKFHALPTSAQVNFDPATIGPDHVKFSFGGIAIDSTDNTSFDYNIHVDTNNVMEEALCK